MPYLAAALSALSLGAILYSIYQGFQIMSKQDDAAAALDAVSATLDKVAGETTNLLDEVATLQQTAANEGVSPTLQAAIDRVAAKANAVDALVPDVPATTDPAVGDGVDPTNPPVQG